MNFLLSSSIFLLFLVGFLFPKIYIYIYLSLLARSHVPLHCPFSINFNLVGLQWFRFSFGLMGLSTGAWVLFYFFSFLKIYCNSNKSLLPFSLYLIWMQMESIYLENSYFIFCNLEPALEHNALFLCRRVYFLYFFSIQGLIQPSVLFRLWKSSK